MLAVKVWLGCCSCRRKVEVVVSGFNPERRVGGSDESAVCPMTLSVEDHRRRR